MICWDGLFLGHDISNRISVEAKDHQLAIGHGLYDYGTSVFSCP